MKDAKLFMKKIDISKSELNDYAAKLRLSDFLREPVMRSVIRFLHIPPSSQGLDIGCGIGSNTQMLAEAAGLSGHVTGIDLSLDLSAYARQSANMANLSQQVSFQQGDMNNLAFDNDSFDWAWSADCVGYAPGDACHVLKEIARVVKPGGSVSILAWSSQQLLPGYPQLEARLNATSAGIAPFAPDPDRGRQPESHFLRTLGRLKTAGLKESKACTFAGNIQAPLNDEKHKALISLFEMRWGSSTSELAQKDQSDYQRLCQPDSPDFILNCPDYYGFFTYTLFHGRVAGIL